MSGIKRRLLSSLAGLCFACIPFWAHATDGSAASATLESGSIPSSPASYLRVPGEFALTDDAIPGPSIEVSEKTAHSSEAQSVVSTTQINPAGGMYSNRGPITLAALPTPSVKLDGIGTGVRPDDVTIGRLPISQWLPTGQTREGDWSLQAKPWIPGGFCHQPLYFEDPMLERHGHERFPHLQPLVSGIRFFGTVPIMPYLATLRQPLDEVHTLGSYRPGTSAPMLRYRPHYDTTAIRNELIWAAGATAVAAP
jgi:hypothetical protein